MLSDKEFLYGVYRKAEEYSSKDEHKVIKINWVRNISAAAAILVIAMLAVSAGDQISLSEMRNDDQQISIAGYQDNLSRIDGIVTDVSTDEEGQSITIRTDEGKMMELYWYGINIDITEGSRFSAMVEQKGHILVIQDILEKENK